MKIILASSSVSRKNILSSLGFSFKVIPNNIDEEEVKKTIKDIPQIVKTLALKKAEAVERIVKKKKIKDYLIIGADSLAEIDGIYLDKPKDQNHARKMLLMSKGRSHRFYSGVAIINSTGKRKTIVGESKVFFNNFTDEQLNDVIDSGIWKGRAGGYDIKDDKSNLIEKYEGSYTNILGLPVEELEDLLKEFGIKINNTVLRY
ncbi:septum formation protein Maf [Candidatus Microgenomates bacterium]|nr:septum formation protein Maf [Candidatus Microgenomates bacterium]